MRPYPVVVLTPDLDFSPSVSQIGKPVGIQAFVAELAIEAFDEAVLDRLARADEVELDAAPVGPGIQRSAGERPMQHVGASRRELYERLDRPALKPLPAERYQMAEWKPCRVNIDYHVEVGKNYYSVPYQLVGELLEARFTPTIVEVYFKSKRVASHRRLSGRGQASSETAHMPSSHRAHAEWTPSRLVRWAEKTGLATGRLVTEILKQHRHPEQGYRACLGILRLGKRYGSERLEAAAVRAERLRSYSYRTIKNILSSGADRLPLEEESSPSDPTPLHDNIRGADYYAQKEIEC